MKIVLWNSKGFFGNQKISEYHTYVLESTSGAGSLTLKGMERINMFFLDNAYYINFCAFFKETTSLKIYQLIIKKAPTKVDTSILHSCQPVYQYDFEPKGIIQNLFKVKKPTFFCIKKLRYLFNNLFLIVNEKSELLIFDFILGKVIFELPYKIEDIENATIQSKMHSVVGDRGKLSKLLLAMLVSNIQTGRDVLVFITINLANFTSDINFTICQTPPALDPKFAIENIFEVKAIEYPGNTISAFEYINGSWFVNLFNEHSNVNETRIITLGNSGLETKTYENVSLTDQNVIYTTNNLIVYLRNQNDSFNLQIFLDSIFESNLFSTSEFEKTARKILENGSDQTLISHFNTLNDQYTKNTYYSLFETHLGSVSKLNHNDLENICIEIVSLLNFFYFRNNRISMFVKSRAEDSLVLSIKDNGKLSLICPAAKSIAFANYLKAYTNSLNNNLYSNYVLSLNVSEEQIGYNTKIKLFDYRNSVIDIFSTLIECLKTDPGETLYDLKAVNYIATEVLREKFTNDVNPRKMEDIVNRFILKMISNIDQEKYNNLIAMIIINRTDLQNFFLEFVITFNHTASESFASINYDQNPNSKLNHSYIKLLFNQLIKYFDSELSVFVLMLAIIKIIKRNELEHLFSFKIIEKKLDDIYLKHLDKSIFVYYILKSLVKTPVNQEFKDKLTYLRYCKQNKQLYIGEDIFINLYLNSFLHQSDIRTRPNFISWVDRNIDLTREFFEYSSNNEINFELSNICEYLGHRV